MVRPWQCWRAGAGRRIHFSSALLILWAIFIVYGTMLPFDFTLDAPDAAKKVRALAETNVRTVSRTDVVSNVLLFIPLGFLFSLRLAGGPTGFGLGMTLVGATLGGLALSGLVEIGQLFLPSRTSSLVDLTTNSTGAALGALMGWAWIRRAWPRWSPALRQLVSRRPMAACALAAGVGLGVAGLAPFDVSIDLGDLKAAIKRAQPIPFGPPVRGQASPAEPWSWAEEGLIWVLAGGLVALALDEAGWHGSRAILSAAVLCGGLGLVIEVAQVAIPSRTVNMTSFALALAGSAVGATAVVLHPRQAPHRWTGPAIWLWGTAVLLSAWTPPHLASPDDWSLRWSQLVPFWVYYERTDVYALADLFNQVLSFVPLGVLLAARDSRKSIRRASVLGLAFGLVLEAGQLVLADRTAEITDALSAGAGAALGAWLWGWGTSIRDQAIGYRRYRVR
jgi:VanZ family protein